MTAMVNAAALSALATSAQPRAEPPRAPQGFSFDAAVAAATRNAARALDIHGGAPTGAVTQGVAGAETADAADAAAPESIGDAAAAPERTVAGEAAASNTASRAAPAPSPLIAAATQASVTTGAAAPAAATPLQTPALATAAIRDAAARIKTETPRAALPFRAPAQTLTQFAEILARRLDGASQFDLRLDPPALGGVEGRLTLSDDGAALLSLTFDNQSAFDLLRRDEAALRSALASAGFDLSQHNLQMSFRAPESAHAEPLTELAAEKTAFAPAPLHRGAVDIRA